MARATVKRPGVYHNPMVLTVYDRSRGKGN